MSTARKVKTEPATVKPAEPAQPAALWSVAIEGKETVLRLRGELEEQVRWFLRTVGWRELAGGREYRYPAALNAEELKRLMAETQEWGWLK
jgi:hypothetical protein